MAACRRHSCCCCYCCCFRSVVEFTRTSCHHAVTSTSSPFWNDASSHLAGEGVLQNRAACSPPAARWHNPTPLVRVTLQLHLSSLCDPSGCLVVYTASSAGGTFEAWKMLGVYKPIIWRAKMYRTYRQIPAFAKVLFGPFSRINLKFCLRCFLEEVNFKKKISANTPLMQDFCAGALR